MASFRELKCKRCGETISFSNINTRGLNYDGSKIRCQHANCAKKTEEELKDKYFFCKYREADVYKVEEKYLPYWGCRYCFLTLEDCKKRIDLGGKVSVFL